MARKRFQGPFPRHRLRLPAKRGREGPVNFADKSFFLFLPLVLLGYHLLPGRTNKYRFLLAASWLFYASWNPYFLWVILFTTVVDFFAGRLIEGAGTPGRRRL